MDIISHLSPNPNLSNTKYKYRVKQVLRDAEKSGLLGITFMKYTKYTKHVLRANVSGGYKNGKGMIVT